MAREPGGPSCPIGNVITLIRCLSVRAIFCLSYQDVLISIAHGVDYNYRKKQIQDSLYVISLVKRTPEEMFKDEQSQDKEFFGLFTMDCGACLGDEFGV
jgi:hypothetical protein